VRLDVLAQAGVIGLVEQREGELVEVDELELEAAVGGGWDTRREYINAASPAVP
jgi:hypothetical protein